MLGAVISQYVISEQQSGDGGTTIIIGDLDIQASLLWNLELEHALLWDLDLSYTLLWDLDLITYGEDDMPVYVPIDIGDTVTLTTKGVFGGELVGASAYILQIKTPDLRQWPDIPGTELDYNTVTQRYEYRYHITDAHAQPGDHYYRFKVVTDAGETTAAKWQKLVVRAMPFSET
jgi:hypothetical protein